MNEELAILYQVQQFDIEIARRQQALAEVDTGAELEQRLETVKSELTVLRQAQTEAEKENLDCELQARTLQEKRKRFSDQLYSGKVSNPRQLSDLQEEVEMLGREVRRVEDRMLELMETMEVRRGEIASRELVVKELEEELAAVRARHEEVGSRLRGELSELEASRADTAQKVNRVVLKRYEQIRARSGNVGLVKVTGGECPGCRIALPSETLKQVKAGRSGLTCENCGRLLLWGGPEQGGAEE
ncbi:MAG: zinc ribbon domain-containing protein [Armatimonadota bacterium]